MTVTDVRLEFDPTKTQVQLAHYIKAYRLYHGENWIAYDPTAFIPELKEIEDVNLGNFFKIIVQYTNPLATPRNYLSNCSAPLSHFFRALIGGSFFDPESLYEVTRLFPRLSELREVLSESLTVATSNIEDKQEFLADTIGRRDLAEADDEAATAAIVEFSEHFGVLIKHIEEDFKSTGDRLALVKGYGHIEFELLALAVQHPNSLLFLFEPGDHLVTMDKAEQPIAFYVTSRHIVRHGDDPDVFHITGNGQRWNGSSYVNYKVSEQVAEFDDTVEITSLAFKAINPEVEEKLRERGKKYTAHAGVHYRVSHAKEGGYKCDLYVVTSGFLVEHLSDVTFDKAAWDHLVLDPDAKTLIKGLVAVMKNANSSDGSKIISDVISGKSGGLIAVLHGPPGTGKTLTAESVAETLRRPLYMVGSSELPTHSSALESSLKSVLKLATAWDAVLLIDEADVYLEQRSSNELGRNALVSVALRVLEYHSGVLFLTTNRIKTFNEAFLSRVSIAIKFPELDTAGRFTVWSKFLEMAGCKIVSSELKRPHEESEAPVFLRKDLEMLALKGFNGRTIKNLVRTAQALALSCETDLSAEHVMVVVRAQEKFLDQFAVA
ncbi:P-loop containing nucleoside triphosphate hydrolase protein [Mycena floridula]|nr:P-loop containing nucleoside triphosphate hydrolase protein [Mycena floridula]